MKSAIGLAGLCLALLPSPALAEPQGYVSAENRQAEPQRPIAVLLPQSRIASSIELGRIAFPGGGGGILGTIIIDGQNRIPERLAESALARAEERIVPLIGSLEGFDAGSLASDATKAVLDSTPWLAAGPHDLFAPEGASSETADSAEAVNVSTTYGVGLFGPAPNQTAAVESWAADTSVAQAQFKEAHPAAEELAQIIWRYQMSPDFTQLQVIADVSLSHRDASEPFYAQQLISIVRLRRASYVEEENVESWTSNDGALVKSALASAFARAGEVLPHILVLDQDGLATATDRDRESVTSAGYHGPVLLRDETGPIFWAKDGDQRLAAFITVQVASN